MIYARLTLATLALTAALPATAQTAPAPLPNIAPGAALTQNTQNVANVLNGFTAPLNPAIQGFVNGVNAQPTVAGQNAQLLANSPAAFGNLTNITLQSLHFQDVTVRRYLRDVRQGGTEAGGEAVAYGSDRHYAMWFTGSGRTGDLRGGTDRYRTEYGAYAATGGIDYRFARGTLVGFYGGYDVATAKVSPFSRNSDAETWFGGGYASGTVGPIYIDAHGSYGETRFVARRTIADGFGGGVQFDQSGTGASEPRSYQYQGAVTAGISKDYRGVELEPYVGAKYANVKLEGFSEGSVAGALTLPRLQTDSLESIAGLRLGFKIPIAGTQTVVRPSVRGEYRHEFENAGRGRDILAGFSDGAGGNVLLPFRTTPFDRDYAAVGGGFTVSGASPISFVVDYSGQFGRDRQINGITGGFHLAF